MPSSHIGSTGVSHGVATTTIAGFMSATDKTKLDGISANAYTHPVSGITAGTYKSVSVNTEGHITSGTNPTTLAGYSISDATPSSHIGSTGTAHGVVTTSVAGFMSAADKVKLDSMGSGGDYTHPVSGVTAGTYKAVTVDIRGHVTDGTNPTTLAGYGITDAAAASHTHTIISYSDTRSENFNPTSYPGLSLHLKLNTTDGLDDGGGGYHSVLNLMSWNDYSCGRAHQLGFTDNGNMHIRSTADGTTFSSWGKVWTSLNDGAGSGLDADLLDGLPSASTNTASTVVTRDSSGNFSAGTITATLSGNASTAHRADGAGWADGATYATRLDGDIIKTSGQDLTFWSKRAMVGDNAGNQLIINYGNDWGSTAIQGDLYAGAVQSARHVVIHNGSTVYGNSGLEVRTMDGSDARIGFHRVGYTAGAINHNAWGFQFERESGGGSRANVAAANFFADAAQDTAGNALTRKDYVDSNLDAKAGIEHVHNVATQAAAGFMSSADKLKLDGMATGGNAYVHPTGDGSLHVPATGTNNNEKWLKAGATEGALEWATISKYDVGLGNVDNTSDLDKPISTATQTVLNTKYSPTNKPTAADVGALPAAGTAAAATKLATARTIAGKSFDGTANISIAAADVGALATTGGALSGDVTSYGIIKLTNAVATVGIANSFGRNIVRGSNIAANVFGNATDAMYLDGNSLTAWQVRYGSTLYPIYHTGNKPTPAEIGAQPATSDIRVKSNIESLAPVLDKIMLIDPKTFNMNDREGRCIGTIAQDWEVEFPEVILSVPSTSLGEAEMLKGIDALGTIGILLKAIQELKAEIDDLKNK